MVSLDYIVIGLYFLSLIFVSWLTSRRIKSSEDMFIAGRNSSWWLSGMSTYMTLFSASTFVIWGGVSFRSGLVAALIGNILGLACFAAGRWFAGRWRRMKIKSPGEFLTIRFGGRATINFYTICGIVGRGFHTAVALYAIAIVMSTLIELPEGHFFAGADGHLSVQWAIVLLGIITLIYTVTGGFLAVLMTDVIQFGVLMTIVLFMIPLSIDAVGGLENFIAQAPEGYFKPWSAEYPPFWLIMWFFLNLFTVAGDWPFVQRYLSVPTVKDAKRSNYLVGVLYLLTPIIWYFPAMAYHQLNPDANPEQAYILMSKTVLMKGMLGVMLAAMISATLSCVSGTLNVFANVFTYDIYCAKYPDTPQKQQIAIGRRFTLIFGLSILILALLIPYAGGAEKVVVTILTMVIGPLYLPSIWGIFSRRITSSHVIWSMLVTYALGFTLKFALGTKVHQQLLESFIGLVIPLLVLTAFELWARYRGKHQPGYDAIAERVDEEAETEPSPEVKRAVKSFSHMAVTCFMATVAAIAVMLAGLLVTEDFTESVRRIVVWSVVLIVAAVAAYVIYRIIDYRRDRAVDAK